MAFIIGGHIRSGTTLLRNLCNSHPDITVTMEFGNFMGLGKSYQEYSRQLLQRSWRRRKQSFLVQGSQEKQWVRLLQSYVFIARYLFDVNKHRQGPVDAPTVATALQSCFPTTRIVGDKLPQYLFLLNELANIDGLARVIVYRDCRDVTRSVLERIRTRWQDKWFINDWDTAEKIAGQWIKAIELMENYADRLYIIRYEDLAREPERELKSLGEYLGVDTCGFPKDMIHSTSIGKYKNGLSEEELSKVLDIAGPTMARLGYL